MSSQEGSTNPKVYDDAVSAFSFSELFAKYKSISQNIEANINILEVSAIWRRLRYLLSTSTAAQDEARNVLFKEDNLSSVFAQTAIICEKLEVQEQLSSHALLSFFLQFHANFVTKHSPNKVFLIEFFFDNDFESKFASSVDRIYSKTLFENAKLRKFVATFLYNLMFELPIDVVLKDLLPSALFQRFLRGIMLPLLARHSRASQTNKQNKESTEIETPESQQETEATYWTMLVLSQVFRIGADRAISIVEYLQVVVVKGIRGLNHIERGLACESQSFAIVSPDSSTDKFAVLEIDLYEDLQLLLFHVSQKFVDDKVIHSFIKGLEVTIEDVRQTYEQRKNDYQFNLNEMDLTIISAEFCHLVDLFQQQLDPKNKVFVGDTPIDPADKVKFSRWMRLTHDKLRLLAVFTFLGGYNNALQKRLVENGVFESTMRLNQLLQDINKSGNNDPAKPRIEFRLRCLDFFDSEAYQDLFSSILRFLSNIVHIHRAAQDLVASSGYLVSCLSQTHMDTTNPLQREWSVMLIRNLCDGNHEVQEAISKLEVQDFSEKTKEILDKYKEKREELSNIQKTFQK